MRRSTTTVQTPAALAPRCHVWASAGQLRPREYVCTLCGAWCVRGPDGKIAHYARDAANDDSRDRS